MIDPGERAVALRYTAEAGGLPEVTAKERGAIAAQIKAIASAHGLQAERDAYLLAVLDELDVGSTIPKLAFPAVAEILAQLYRPNVAPAAGERLP